MMKNEGKNVSQLVDMLCRAVIDKDFNALPLYENLKQRIPNETQRLNAILKTIDEEYHNYYLIILSRLSSFDGAHS